MVYRLEADKLREDSVDLFIEIVKRRPRTQAIIVGGGTFLRPYLEQTIAAGVRDNFYFTGYVSYDQLPDLYDRFCLFVAPVWQESFGQVVPFAMAKGLAVAGYAVGALPEIIGSDANFGRTVDEAAAKVIDLLNEPSRLRVDGSANRDRAFSQFSVEAMVQRYKDLYDSLVPHTPPSKH